MSKSTDPEFDLELHFLPAWAQQSSDTKQFEHYQGESERSPSRGRQGGDRPGGRRPRPSGAAGGGPRSGGGDRSRSGGGPRGRGKGSPDRGDRRPPVEEAPPLPLNVAFVPDDHGVDSLARQIRMTGRAYPLFDIARMVMQKPERHSVTISVIKEGEGKVKQPLFGCAIDDTVWLSEDDAVQHVLNKHFNLFYQPERTEVPPPKGTYTFVAQCGMSGVILGPPNYHDYQNQLRKLHAARFSRMPFETFKARVKIVKDEEVVKKWLEDQSYTTEYHCLNLPEPLKLPNREEVEKHFRATHLANIIRPVESVSLKGTAVRDIRTPALFRLIRGYLDDQRRFPLQVATVLSQQFAARGLQFFKVKKTVTHVSVARPHYLDLEATPVSDGVKKIVQFIDSHPGCTRKTLFEYFLPESVKPRPAASPSGAATAPAEIEAPSGTAQSEPGPAPSSARAHEPSPEETALITDLHWLVHQGHVIEFADGLLETAKKPVAKPPKPAPAPKKEEPSAEVAAGTETSTGDSSVADPAATDSGMDAPSEEAKTQPVSEVQPAPVSPPQASTSPVVAESSSEPVSPVPNVPEASPAEPASLVPSSAAPASAPTEPVPNPEIKAGESLPVSDAAAGGASSEETPKPS